MKMKFWLICCALFLLLLFPSFVIAQEVIELDFTQWWEPELPTGALREIVDQFEAENSNIKINLVSGPYASTREQIVAGAATGTMSDIVGLDGAWIHDFVRQNALADLSKLINENEFDASLLSREVKINDVTYMIPVVNFIYPLFLNMDILNEHGINDAPINHTEFLEIAKTVTNEKENVYGWVIPLSLEAPNGIKNDIMSLLWASGDRILENGSPNLTSDEMVENITFVKNMYDSGVVLPGAFGMREQDKVEEFTNGRVAMMISSMAHINLLRKNNPDLNFSISPLPVKDRYEGKSGICSASWGLGIAENSEHKEEAWKFIEFLMSEKINSQLSTYANAFPGNNNSVPSFVEADEIFATAFKIFQNGQTLNEFEGLPVAIELQRSFDEELQLMLEGDQTIEEMLENAQVLWDNEF